MRCVNEQGFSLHAEVCCAAHERKKLEHLCRYITRPAIANERLTLNRAGQVVLTLKTPYRDGTTHIVMSPLEFMQRLAALIPRPRLHLIRFHGVLAPNARQPTQALHHQALEPVPHRLGTDPPTAARPPLAPCLRLPITNPGQSCRAAECLIHTPWHALAQDRP
ncbi:MAG: transposase [Beggiatoa sp.]|nr:transposase [Beggiatoa sp.]